MVQVVKNMNGERKNKQMRKRERNERENKCEKSTELKRDHPYASVFCLSRESRYESI